MTDVERAAPAASARASASPAGAGATFGIQVSALNKRFRRRNGAEVVAVDNVSFAVPQGSFWALLGPSGCGKTTLLRCIAGLERPDSGTIAVGGRAVFSSSQRINAPTERRGIGMVFQSYALWPHMNVRRNVGFPLTTGARRKRISRSEIEERVRTALETVGIADLIDQPIDQLSGGQQQRVSLARAIVAGNDVILFDEPLSNVDAKVREQLRVEIKSLQRRLGFTALYVTHDQQEAMEVADKIAVLQDGKIAQLGPVNEVYDSPASRYVAEFIGAANVLPGTVVAGSPRPTVATALGPVEVDSIEGRAAGSEAVVVSRAHRWRIVQDVAEPNHWRATVESVSYAGSHFQVMAMVNDQLIRIWSMTQQPTVREGDSIVIAVDPADCRIVDP